jgi:hypothetical protein
MDDYFGIIATLLRYISVYCLRCRRRLDCSISLMFESGGLWNMGAIIRRVPMPRPSNPHHLEAMVRSQFSMSVHTKHVEEPSL